MVRISRLASVLAIALLPTVLAPSPSSAALVTPPFLDPALVPINPIAGDESFVAAFGRSPNPTDDEDLRIDTHLAFVIDRLSRRDVSDLSPALQAARREHLERLCEYRARGEFPRNHDRAERAPCFIDRDGRICAVGYLIEQSAGRAVAEAINARYQYATVAEIAAAEEARAWIAASGFTVRELGMIQPFYLPMEICGRFTGHSYSAGGSPPVKLCLVGKVDLSSGIFANQQIDGELTLVLDSMAYYGGSSGAMYMDGRLELRNDPQGNGLYLPDPPNAMVPAGFNDGALFAAGPFDPVMGDYLYLQYDPGAGQGTFFGQLQLNDGLERVQFGHGYVWIMGTVHPSTLAGYDLEWEGTLSSGCDLTPVADSTWGQIKSQYR